MDFVTKFTHLQLHFLQGSYIRYACHKMWRSGIVLASFLILPTVVSIYSKNRLKNVSNLGISTNSTLRKVRSQERPESKLPDYRYKEELSRELDKNLIAFIQNIIPSIKPKVNWMADSIRLYVKHFKHAYMVDIM